MHIAKLIPRCFAIVLLLALTFTSANAAAVCTHGNPLVQIAPSVSGPGAAGRLEQFTVSLTNQDSADCGNSTFLLSTTPPMSLPDGWTIVLLGTSFSLDPGQTGATTLQVRSPLSAPSSNYDVTVTGLNYPEFSIRTSATATYVVGSVMLADFAISAQPSAIPVQQGSNAVINVSSTVSGGFSSGVSLSISGLPAGVSPTFSVVGFAAPGSGTSILTLNAASNAQVGTTNITIAGTSAGTTHSTTVQLTVTAVVPVLTSIVVTPANESLIAGDDDQYLAVGQYSNNTTQNLTTQVTWASSNQKVAEFLLGGLLKTNASGTTTISATLNSVTGSTLLTVTPAPVCRRSGPKLVIDPASSPTGPAGRLESYNVSITNEDTQDCGGSTFLLSATAPAALPNGWTTVLVKNTFTLNPGETGTTTLQVTSPNNAPGGSYDVTVQGVNWPVFTFTTNALATYVINTVVAPDFSISAAPQSLSLQQAVSGTVTVTTMLANGLNSDVALSVSGLPEGVSAGFVPDSIGAPGSGTSTLTLSASSTATPGTVNITITGTAGVTTHSTTVGLTVTSVPPTLNAIAVTPAEPLVSIGTPQQFAAIGIYSNSSIQNLTNQVTWDSSDYNVATIDATGLASTLAEGTARISATLGGVGGGTLLTVNRISQCTLAAPGVVVAPLSSPAGAAGRLEQYTVTLTNLNSNACTASTFLLNAAPPQSLPDGWTVSLVNTSFSLAPGESATTTLQVRSPANAPSSNYAVTITGLNWPVFTFRTDVPVIYVTGSGAADFTVTPAPTSVTVPREQNATVNVIVGVVNGFSAPIGLSASSLPAGVSASFSPVSFPAPGSGIATLTLTASGAATVGLANVSVTATSGAFTLSATIALNVTAAPPVLNAISVTPSNLSLPLGSTQQFLATGLYSNNSTQDLTSQVTWQSSNPTTATITPGGLATTKAIGSSTISATLGSLTGGTLLTVSASVGCVHGNPTFVITPAQSPAGPAGKLVQYSVALTNTDSPACDASEFLLNLKPPTNDGWIISLLDTSFTLLPGQTGTTTMQVRSPATTGSGIYNVSVTGLNWPNYTYQNTATAQYAIQ
jgi:trimeric autotransporter adhesin